MAHDSGLSPELPLDPSWSHIVNRIKRGDPSGMEDLYSVFRKGVRYYMCRRLGPQDLDDRLHEAFISTTQAIRKGGLREPERLMGFVRTVVRRQVASHIEEAVEARRQFADAEVTLRISDRKPDPECVAIESEKNEVAMRVLNSITQRDREVLIRFYLKEQTPRQICRELELTDTQFRLIKSRAKARFGELGKRRFATRHSVRTQ